MYSITLKPQEDTPRLLLQYAISHHVGAGWSFLTGAPEDIEQIRRKLGFVDPDPVVDADVAQHTGVIRFGSEPLQRWSMAPGTGNPEFVTGLIRSALSLDRAPDLVA
jgi:protein SCO1/2